MQPLTNDREALERHRRVALQPLSRKGVSPFADVTQGVTSP